MTRVYTPYANGVISAGTPFPDGGIDPVIGPSEGRFIMIPDRIYAAPGTRGAWNHAGVRQTTRQDGRPSPPLSTRPTLRLAALPTAPHMARVFVAHTARQLHLSGECAETAKLLASELVTNAARATGRVEGQPTPRAAELVAVVVVRVQLVPGALRIDVWDADHRLPKVGAPELEDLTGRGLLLVATLAAQWGSYPTVNPRMGTTGKVVWCDVAAA